MKTLNNLERGDYIAFGFNYNGGEPNEIIVDDISIIGEDYVIVPFVYGYETLEKIIKKEDILATGNNKSGKEKINGWSGKYDILNKEKINEIESR